MSAAENSLPATKRQGTESISFRLNAEDLERLRNLAAERKESLNSIVSQIIDKYLKIWIFDHSYGFFPISIGVLRSALTNLNDKAISDIASEQASKVHKGIILDLYVKITKETVVNYLDVFASRFESAKHHRDGRMHTLTVFHGVDSVQFSKLHYDITSSVLRLAKIETIESGREIGENNFAISF